MFFRDSFMPFSSLSLNAQSILSFLAAPLAMIMLMSCAMKTSAFRLSTPLRKRSLVNAKISTMRFGFVVMMPPWIEVAIAINVLSQGLPRVELCGNDVVNTPPHGERTFGIVRQ